MLAIADRDRRIVVDPWLANDYPRYRDDAAARVASLLAELADAGFPSDEVDTVVNTHFDGIGWNTLSDPDHPATWTATFPNARYLYPAAELAAWRAGTYPPGEDGLAVLAALGVLDGIELPHEVSDHVRLRDRARPQRRAPGRGRRGCGRDRHDPGPSSSSTRSR